MTDAMLLRPRRYGPQPAMRARILGIRDRLLAELDELDDRARRLALRRIELTRRLEVCRQALGQWCPPEDTFLPRVADLRGRVPRPRVLKGGELRKAAAVLLISSGVQMRLYELHAALLLNGVDVADPPSRQLANALRPEVAAGRVLRYGWGLYGAPGASRTVAGTDHPQDRSIWSYAVGHDRPPLSSAVLSWR